MTWVLAKVTCYSVFSTILLPSPLLKTIAIDFKIRCIELDGKRIRLQIWDTSGLERFRNVTTGIKFHTVLQKLTIFIIGINLCIILVYEYLIAYYHGAMGILLVYDVINKRSFKSIL